MSNLVKVSATADHFEHRLDKKTGLWTVSWFDRENDGTLVTRLDPQQFRKEERARERIKQLRREVERLRPTVRLCPNRNLYVLHVYIGDPPRLTRRSLGTRDPDEVPARMEKVLAKLGLGEQVSQLTIGAMMDQYMADGLQSAVVAVRRSFVRLSHNLQDFLGRHKNVYDIKDADLAAYLEHRAASVSAASLRVETGFWNAAVRWHMRKKLFADGKTVPLMERPQVPHKDKLLLAKDDHSALVEAAKTWRKNHRKQDRSRPGSLEIYLNMVRYTGGRSCFYDDLQWSQVDFANGMIDFQPAGVVVAANKRRPTVPIAAELMPYLRDIHARRQPGETHVLWQRGIPITTRVYTFKKLYLSKSEDPRLRQLADSLHSHAFRRAYITWAMSAGLSASLVARVTGNSAATIEAHYFAYRPDMGRAVVDSV